MKKNLFYLFALICSVSLFTSCSDDDDPVYPIEEELAGTYKGTLDIELDGNPVGVGLPKNITIAKSGNNIISLELKDFSFMGNNLGTIKLEKCALKQSGTSYTFTGEQELNLANGIGKCNVTLSGTLGAGKAEVNLNIAVQQLGETVKVVYKGDKLAGSESSEAKIVSFTFDPSNSANAIVTEQPIINDDNTIVFKVDENATAAELKALVPTITVSDKATFSVENGTADFSADVVYTVVAENGAVATYKVISPSKTSLVKFSLDEWEPIKEGSYAEYWAPLPTDQLASSNGGVKMVNGSANPVGYPVMVEDEGYQGKAAKLVTLDARVNPLTATRAPIASGSLFTGYFNFNFMTALSAPLKMTEFGKPYDKVPLSFKGVYKYKGGDNYVDASDLKDIKEHLDIQDECAIQAILYEATDADGKDVILTGLDINTSDYRIAFARLADGSDKAEWTTFNIPFEYFEGKTYDKEKSYKLAIICSSSKEGDKFKGAIGSTLIVDELEVLGE